MEVLFTFLLIGDLDPGGLENFDNFKKSELDYPQIRVLAWHFLK